MVKNGRSKGDTSERMSTAIVVSSPVNNGSNIIAAMNHDADLYGAKDEETIGPSDSDIEFK